jgi:large subunit ribosomal protein L22
MRQVADLVRGKDVEVALHTLQFVTRTAAVPMRKLIQSAAANAREKAAAEDRRFDADQLFVKSVAVDEGPTLKRWRPRAQGRAFRIRKRTCHVKLVLQEYEDAVEANAGDSAAAEAAEGKSSRKRKGSKSASQDAKAAAS